MKLIEEEKAARKAARDRERHRIYRAKNREKTKAATYLSRKRNPEKYREIAHRAAKNGRAALNNTYIANALKISIKYLPKELIEAKREQLKLVRLLKEKHRVEDSAR